MKTMADVKRAEEIVGAMHSPSDSDRDLITRAYALAYVAHEGQTRFSGEPYFIHVAEVGYSLATIGMDAQTVAAGLLHDTMEDAGTPAAQIEKEFGTDVLLLVRGVTKLGALRYRGMERHTESLRRLFAATAQDIRVLIIKLMDRLHNAQTLEHVPVEKRKRIALETLEVYAPIADRLGMSVVKTSLEDAAFPHAYPAEYEKTKDLLRDRRMENQSRLEKAEKDLKRALSENSIRDFRMEARMKGTYSLFRKLERKDWDITKIFDILALRIIVPSLADCYASLGIVHKQWRPVPGKIKDYIAFPKPNGYRSIHTTVYTGDGGALEIQIRTEEMHREAQYGIASHLTYKEDRKYVNAPKASGLSWIGQFLPRLSRASAEVQGPEPSRLGNIPQWVRELAQAQNDGSEESLESLKGDFFTHRVFVFTPKSDVIDLPLGATPIDFAYAIHSEIANKMAGARVNGKMVSLEQPLRNGDLVEILTRPSAKPSRKWLEHAKTTLARKMIRAALASDKSSV
jgi:GTP pyrophosphokinase